ncbi:MAG: hypothetical protein ACRDNZ_17355, partial [Streptosporangiaceae bacterium]
MTPDSAVGQEAADEAALPAVPYDSQLTDAGGPGRGRPHLRIASDKPGVDLVAAQRAAADFLAA